MKIPRNPWLMALSAVGTQLSIGSIYAYSAWKMPLENTFGWSATKTAMAFSIAICSLGLSAAFLGKVIERRGPRFGCIWASLFFGLGLMGSSLACRMENLWLFYTCFGVISGIGLGLGYISPVSTLVRWFPNNRGLATGLAIMGFGFGGMLCTQLIDVFSPAVQEIQLPEGVSAYEYTHASPEEQGVWQAAVTEDSHTVLLYDKAAISGAFFSLGIIYLCIMIPSALYISPPRPGEVPEVEAKASNFKGEVAMHVEVEANEAIRKPMFYGLWLMLFINATCGIALIATAKKMGYEMVHLSAAMASAMVMGISLFNGLGRIFWSTLSDYIGRPNTFVAFFLIEIVAIPTLAHVSSIPWLFLLLTFIVLSCYGGGFATIPAYITDLFGMKSMPVILGWILTAWSCAGIVGPMVNAQVYEATHSYQISLYVFGAALLLGLGISLWMKSAVKRTA